MIAVMAEVSVHSMVHTPIYTYLECCIHSIPQVQFPTTTRPRPPNKKDHHLLSSQAKEKPAIGSYRNLPYAHQAAKYIRGSRENLSCRESLLDAERRNARRGYENESEALKYLQEYAGKVGEKRRWRSQAIQDRVEDRGPWSGDRRKG
jgi:hypothetical protein